VSRRSLRILVLSPGLPLPTWGTGTRIYQLARHLSLRNEVTVLSYVPPSDEAAIAPLSELCHEVRQVPCWPGGSFGRRVWQARWSLSPAPFLARELYSTRMQVAIDAVLADRRFDIVQLESSQMCCFRLRTDAHVVLDEHNIEYEILGRMQQGERSPLRRAHYRLEEFKVRRVESRWWEQVDGVAVPSGREALVVRQRAPGTPTAVVPNGVDLEYFTPSIERPEPDHIVFTGLMTYRPNLDAAQFLVHDILPRLRRLWPGVTLTVVGAGQARDLDLLRQPGVAVTGWVRDVRPYMQRASVLVTPLRIGGGTRLKVIEGLAMAKPMVSTSVGCEGLDVRHGEHLLVADDPDEFARHVARLLANPDLGRRLGEMGRAAAAVAYSWDGATEQLEDLYDRLVHCPPARGFHRMAREGASRVA